MKLVCVSTELLFGKEEVFFDLVKNVARALIYSRPGQNMACQAPVSGLWRH